MSGDDLKQAENSISEEIENDKCVTNYIQINPISTDSGGESVTEDDEKSIQSNNSNTVLLKETTV